MSVASATFGADAARAMGGGDAEYASDNTPAGFFSADFKRHDDLKQMLDSNKDNLKLEAMKRIIGMVARGRDASDLFPAVVKNVVSKNIELKKLVYTYLVRYAEEKQDLALLSISTFQRALKDPNQLIRANALRVLSSIRVPVIVPIMMLAISDCVVDMSPYVRKTVAHAIPKLYSLDAEQKEELVTVIQKLLSDRTTLVIGSAVMAFEEVCPERIDLVHKNYRRLCNVLVDIEEWGQVVIINMLTRYARSQFVDPNLHEPEEDGTDKPFYESEESEDGENDADGRGQEEEEEGGEKPQKYVMDPDHRLLLRSARPLLQSRNSAVVMGVAQLYHHLAPRAEVSDVAKAMVRLTRSNREVQSVVLTCIASMTTQRKGMFEPYLKSFFVHSSDASHTKLLKLEVLTNLASETNISLILREFQTYILSCDKRFVAGTVQAIGRCASNITAVTDTCLQGLVALLSNRDESVVAESVVVIKNLLQTQPGEHRDIIRHMAKLVDSIKVPMARASILWLIGEYCERIPKIAPDVLRKMAKSFTSEEDIVKLQVLNLASKVCLHNPQQTELLAQYVYTLARYDVSYDIRDRARLMQALVFPSAGVDSKLGKYARRIFMATKPAPKLESSFKDRETFQLASLSHYLNARAVGYQDLPSFPSTAPDPSVRHVVISPPPAALSSSASHQQLHSSQHARAAAVRKAATRQRGFYSSSSSSSDDSSEMSSSDTDEDGEGTGDSESDSETSGASGDEEGSSAGENSGSADSRPTHPAKYNKKPAVAVVATPHRAVSSLRPVQASSSSSGSSSESSDDEQMPAETIPEAAADAGATERPPDQLEVHQPATSGADVTQMSLELNNDDAVGPMNMELLTPSLGGFLTPLCAAPQTSLPIIPTTGDGMGSPTEDATCYIPPVTWNELVSDELSSDGLLQVQYRYSRVAVTAGYSPTSAPVAVQIVFSNCSQQPIRDLSVCLSSSTDPCVIISDLSAGETATRSVTVSFGDETARSVPLRLAMLTADADAEPRAVSIISQLTASVGELVRPVGPTESAAVVTRLQAGFCEESRVYGSVRSAAVRDTSDICRAVLQTANLCAIEQNGQGGDNSICFAGRSCVSGALAVVSVTIASLQDIEGSTLDVSVDCDEASIRNELLRDLLDNLKLEETIH